MMEPSSTSTSDHSPHRQEGGRGFKPTPADSLLQEMAFWQMRRVGRLGSPISEQEFRQRMIHASIRYCELKRISLDRFEAHLPGAIEIYRGQIIAFQKGVQSAPTWLAGLMDALLPPGAEASSRKEFHPCVP